MTEERISTAQDFPNLAVYQRSGPGGPVYRIAFTNLELGSAAKRTLLAMLWVASVAATVAAMPGLGYLWELGGPDAVLMPVFFAALAAPVVLYRLLNPPYKVARAIELDIGLDRLRVLRNDQVEIERLLSGLANLTVADHPHAEFKRAERQLKNVKALSDEEQEHCLIGWFGPGGGQQVILVTRFEAPSHHSLFEVRQAILWARDRPPGGPAAAEAPRPEAGGINPPLD